MSVSKVETGGWESVVHFYIAMTLGKCSIWLKQRFYEIKFIFYNQLYLHKIIASCVLLMFVFDLIWSSSKMLSSVNFSSESASEVKYNLIMDLVWATVLVDLIHSLQSFA